MRKRKIHYGANLDVMTLSGYSRGKRGLWKEVYGKEGYPRPQCMSWKAVGNGCDCEVVCASFTSKKKGTTKKKARAKCRTKCKTRKKRGRRT